MIKELEKDDTILYVIPSKDTICQTIYLTKSKSAWLTITWLSDELINYTQNKYQSLFNLHPVERGKVVMHDEEVQSLRWHKSYLNTPLRNENHAKKSYMYSGKNIADNDISLPNLFQPYLDFINKNERNDKYNQVIVNWYLNGQDYIAAHSDCQLGMKPDAEISIITLCEKVEHFRELRFTPKKINGLENDAIYNHVKIATMHGSNITMHGDTQNKFRHKVPKALDIDTSRISITCRKF